jgi:hypothetical protein
MGWLDAIFGKGSTKKIKKVHKATSALAGKSKPAESGTAPKVQWTKSEKGNDTAEINGFRATIFKQDDGWNYCISEILDEDDIADGVEDVPWWVYCHLVINNCDSHVSKPRCLHGS